MARKKQKGGYLKGPSHAKGGIAAVVGGQEPVELEGGEYIIKKSTVDKLGKDTLDEINKKGRIPAMAKGGKVKKSKKTPISFEEYTKEMKEVNKKFKLDGKIPYKLTKQEHAERDSLRDLVIQKYDPSYKTKYTKAKAEKKQMGGRVAGGYKPTADIPDRAPFKQGVRMMGHGGEVSMSNDKAGAGDVHTVHSHSGYKAGE